jgi:aspartate 1-decarboxylase
MNQQAEEIFCQVYTARGFAMRWVLRSKIHRATITEANPEYVGSVTVDSALLEAAGFWVGERVLISSNTTGARLESYIIAGKENSGVICMNGPAAFLIKAGEQVVIMGFELTDKPISPKILLVDKKNAFVKYL